MERLFIVWTRIDSLTSQMNSSESGRSEGLDACDYIGFLVSSSEGRRNQTR